MDDDIREWFENNPDSRGVVSIAHASRLIGCAEQELRRVVRAEGTYSRVGTQYVLDEDDVLELADQFEEADECYETNPGDDADDSDTEDSDLDEDDEPDDE